MWRRASLSMSRRLFSTGGNKRVVHTSAISAGLLVLTSCGIYAYTSYLENIGQSFKGTVRDLQGNLAETGIGGGFSDMKDQFGNKVDSKDFLGKIVLVYFGFSHCPDYCPTELRKISKVMDILPKEKSEKVQPIMISCDPGRDTPEVLLKYSKDYHEKLLFLSTSHENTKRVARKYRIYYSKPPEGLEHYEVDHSLYTFVVNQEGEAIQFFAPSSTAADIKEFIEPLIDLWPRK